MRIDYSYDAAGRVTQENWFDVNGNPVDTLTYNFDDAGNLLSASNSAGAYSFTNDAAGHVIAGTT